MAIKKTAFGPMMKNQVAQPKGQQPGKRMAGIVPAIGSAVKQAGIIKKKRGF